MIHAVLIFNNTGLPRLTKFYTPLLIQSHSHESLVHKIFSLISSRPAGLCNFLDAPELQAYLTPKPAPANTKLHQQQQQQQQQSSWQDEAQQEEEERWKVVYRSYATLYFVFVVDGAESELGILDLIQVFVESLDRSFENVCELDLVFHFDEVHHILAEIIQGGLVLETNGEEIAVAVQEASKARKTSFASANPLALGIGGVGGSSTSGGGPRNGGIPTPLGWLTGKILPGVGMR